MYIGFIKNKFNIKLTKRKAHLQASDYLECDEQLHEETDFVNNIETNIKEGNIGICTKNVFFLHGPKFDNGNI
jgi:hypothetical protein